MKVVGSARSGLIGKYLAESCLYSLIAVFIGTVLAAILLPFFNVLADTSLEMPWTSIWLIPGLVGTAIVIGLVSGIYPALIMSGFAPIDAIKGKISGSRSPLLQQGLVVLQFTATVVLIISALVLQKQFDHLMDKPLGYDKEQVVNIMGLNTLEESARLAFKEEIKRLGEIENATLGDYIPVKGSKIENRSFWKDGKKYLDPGVEAARWIIDEDYIPTMKMELVAGRNFRKGTSDAESIIINERMMENMGLQDPVGQRVIDMFDEERINHTLSYRIL